MTPHSGDEPVASSGLNALLTTAVRNSPDHILIEDDQCAVTVAQFVRRAAQLASSLKLGGLKRGERVLIVACAQVEAIVAIAAVLRAGLEPVLTPCGVNPVELATAARVCDVAALIGPARYGALDLGDVYLSAAAIADCVRGILTQGPEQVDGAVDVSFDALDASATRNKSEASDVETPTLVTLAGPKLAPRLITHRQAALFADALSLVEQAGINPSKRLVSLLSPASLAGLVGGPFAALVGASRLVLHGPFAARRFLAHCDAGDTCARGNADRSFHLLAPAEIGRVFEGDSFAADLASLILVSRYEDRSAFSPPASVSCRQPIIDLYTFGEEAVVAQARRNGAAEAPRRATDRSLTDGLGARLNRARAEHRLQGADPTR